MRAARNIPAALAACATALKDAPPSAMGLRSALAQARLRDAAALAPFTNDEARELLEAAMANEPLPAGAVGEAALADWIRGFAARDAARADALEAWAAGRALQ